MSRDVHSRVGSRLAVSTDWFDFTPSWTNVTLGTGSTNTGRWRWLNAEQTEVRIRVTTALGTGGALTGGASITLPTAVGKSMVAGPPYIRSSGVAGYRHTGTDHVGIASTTGGSSLLRLYTRDFAVVNATVPWTWGTGDLIDFNINVEVA